MKYLVPLAAAFLALCVQAGLPGDDDDLPLRSSVSFSSGMPSSDLLRGSRGLAVGALPEERSFNPRGEKIYQSSCRICHDSGALGAPRLGSQQDWRVRITKGRKVLVDNAVKGVGQMPAKGGRSSLTAREVALAIDYMLLKTPAPRP